MKRHSRLWVIAAALIAMCSFSAPPAWSQAISLPESKAAKEEAKPKISAKATPEQDQAIERRLEQIFSELEGAEEVQVTVRSGVFVLSGEVLSPNACE